MRALLRRAPAVPRLRHKLHWFDSSTLGLVFPFLFHVFNFRETVANQGLIDILSFIVLVGSREKREVTFSRGFYNPLSNSNPFSQERSARLTLDLERIRQGVCLFFEVRESRAVCHCHLSLVNVLRISYKRTDSPTDDWHDWQYPIRPS